MESLINFDSTNLEPMILQDKTCDRCFKKQAKQTSFQDTPYCTPRVWICRDGSLSTLPVVRLIGHQVGEEAQLASGLQVVLTQGQKVPRFHVLQFFPPPPLLHTQMQFLNKAGKHTGVEQAVLCAQGLKINQPGHVALCLNTCQACTEPWVPSSAPQIRQNKRSWRDG